MQAELRKTDRIEVSRQPEGTLYLLVNDMRLAVKAVLNISPQGIRVQLTPPAGDLPVSDFEDIVVQYQHKDINLNVNGKIAWNTSTDNEADEINKPTYDIGINLLGPHLLFSLMQA